MIVVVVIVIVGATIVIQLPLRREMMMVVVVVIGGVAALTDAIDGGGCTLDERHLRLGPMQPLKVTKSSALWVQSHLKISSTN